MKTDQSVPLDAAWEITDAAEPLQRKLINHHRRHVGLCLGEKHEYEIDHDRMDTAPKVLGFIHHLCEMETENITPEHLAQLIETAESLGAEVDYTE